MFTTIFTLLALSTSGVPADTNTVSYTKGVSIEFTESTQKKADADCARVLKSIRSSSRDGVCEVKAAQVASN
jgi:hypothetical protein